MECKDPVGRANADPADVSGVPFWPEGKKRRNELTAYVKETLVKAKRGSIVDVFRNTSFLQDNGSYVFTETEFKEIMSAHLSAAFRQESTRTSMDNAAFFLVQEDNRKLDKMADKKLCKLICEALENWLTSHDVNFSAGTVAANIKTVAFFSDIKDTITQICVVTNESSTLGEVIKHLVENKGISDPALIGPLNHRYRLQMKSETPHRKATIRVKDSTLLTSVKGPNILSQAMQARLMGTGVQLLEGRFQGKTNLFEFKLAGTTIPETLRQDTTLHVGPVVMNMAISREPLPCQECGVLTHTKRTCPQQRKRREEQKCFECGEEGHRAIVCPVRPAPVCYACSKPGHFKAMCPSIICYRCGESGHIIKQCKSSGRVAAGKPGVRAAAGAKGTNSTKKQTQPPKKAKKAGSGGGEDAQHTIQGLFRQQEQKKQQSQQPTTAAREEGVGVNHSESSSSSSSSSSNNGGGGSSELAAAADASWAALMNGHGDDVSGS
jgi:hypothetical protein